MASQAYSFNKEASYMIGGVYLATKDLELQNVNIQVAARSAGTANFGAAFPYILSVERYKLPRVKSDAVVDRWRSSPMWCLRRGPSDTRNGDDSVGILLPRILPGLQDT